LALKFKDMKKNIKRSISILGILSLGILPLTQTSIYADQKLDPVLATHHRINKIQLALLLDTSGSMSGLINQAKNQLWETISHLSKELPDAEIEIAVYQYGNDGLSMFSGYTQQVIGFSSNLDEVSSSLFKLSTNGGSEYCGVVIDKAQSDLKWDNSYRTKRVLVIAGNEPFTQGDTPYALSISKAVKKNIQVNTIFCGNKQNGINTKWQEGALLGNGQFFTINHNNEARQMPTPYDDDILTCNQKINKTYVPVYEENVEEQELMYSNDAEQAVAQKERLVEKALIKKNKKLYDKSSWDAVDNYRANSASMDKVIKSGSGELNKRFKGKSKDEIEKEIITLKKEREELHKKLKNLEVKRAEYLAKNQTKSKAEKTLGVQLVQSIIKQ
jgi:hypothetical protein